MRLYFRVAADGASAEVGVTISPSFQKQGIGTEALREAIALLFGHSSAAKNRYCRGCLSWRALHRTHLRDLQAR
jgi:RimJ/RimL family protein N-acetyltransferase